MFQLKEIFKLDKILKLAHHLCAGYKRHTQLIRCRKVENKEWKTTDHAGVN